MNSIILSLLIVTVLQPSLVVEGKPLNSKKFETKIKNVLTFCEIPYNDVFVKLLQGTAAVESDYGINLGDGKYDEGVFQINKYTEKDILNRLISKYPKAQIIVYELQRRYKNKTHLLLEYQIILASILYHSRLDYKTLKDDKWYLSWNWKRYYNSKKGHGTTTQFVKKYEKYVEEI